jgi:hypothetical protein
MSTISTQKPTRTITFNIISLPNAHSKPPPQLQTKQYRAISSPLEVAPPLPNKHTGDATLVNKRMGPRHSALLHLRLLNEGYSCVSAHPLAFLRPDDPAYQIAASTHLSGALSGFRLELANDLTSAHLDVFIATAVLLQCEVWTHTDVGTLAEAGSTYDPLQDSIFTISNSSKEVFRKSFPDAAVQPSVLS